jgi:hypothetical protein
VNGRAKLLILHPILPVLSPPVLILCNVAQIGCEMIAKMSLRKMEGVKEICRLVPQQAREVVPRSLHFLL